MTLQSYSLSPKAQHYWPKENDITSHAKKPYQITPSISLVCVPPCNHLRLLAGRLSDLNSGIQSLKTFHYSFFVFPSLLI